MIYDCISCGFSGSSQLSQSVFETSSMSFSQSDLLEFQVYYGLTQQSAVDNGGYETSTCSTTSSGTQCDEGNLDIQYIMGVAQKTVSIYWYIPSSNNAFVTWLTDIASTSNPPKSNSMSWGSVEQVCPWVGCTLEQIVSVLESYAGGALGIFEREVDVLGCHKS